MVPVTGGTATLTPDQLAGLSLTPPADFSGKIALNVTATSTDGTDTAVTSETLNVSVTAVADAPVLNVADAAGLEDQVIALNIDAALTDSGETLSVTLGNIPDGAVLTLADGTVVPVTGGTATLTPDQLAGLNLTPPADFSGKIALNVTATSTDGTDTATTSGTLNVSVTAGRRRAGTERRRCGRPGRPGHRPQHRRGAHRQRRDLVSKYRQHPGRLGSHSRRRHGGAGHRRRGDPDAGPADRPQPDAAGRLLGQDRPQCNRNLDGRNRYRRHVGKL